MFMKQLLFLVACVASASAQSTNTPAFAPVPSVQTTLPSQPPPITVEIQPTPPNQVISGNLVYEGILVQTVKTDNPLQLINPLAPARYGNGQDNLDLDPITGGVTGLKLFSVGF
jgi:hypothetical protein